MDDEDFFVRLRTTLINEGGHVVEDDVEAGTLTITRYMNRDLEYRTTIRTTRDAFHAYLDSMVGSAARLWPDATPRRAGYNLFLVHLDEEMRVLRGNPDTLDITARRMTPHRSRPYMPDPMPPGDPSDYVWRAAPRERPRP